LVLKKGSSDCFLFSFKNVTFIYEIYFYLVTWFLKMHFATFYPHLPYLSLITECAM